MLRHPNKCYQLRFHHKHKMEVQSSVSSISPNPNFRIPWSKMGGAIRCSGVTKWFCYIFFFFQVSIIYFPKYSKHSSTGWIQCINFWIRPLTVLNTFGCANASSTIKKKEKSKYRCTSYTDLHIQKMQEVVNTSLIFFPFYKSNSVAERRLFNTKEGDE